MIWLGFIGSAVVLAAFFAQGYHFGYKAAKSEDEHFDLSIENGYLKLLGDRMGQIRAAHKGISRLRKRIARVAAGNARHVDEKFVIAGNLRIAEEGLANYAQEVEQLKAERDQWKKRADELFFAESPGHPSSDGAATR